MEEVKMNFVRKIASVLLFLWQLPQNVLGLLVILITGAKRSHNFGHVWLTQCCDFGVSLGYFIIFGAKDYSVMHTDYEHECGHCKQSLYLGPLYLPLIGLPSIVFNIYDRLVHRKWPYGDRYDWYYALPWEAWADKLGDVER
jgi:hypothetical protein